MSTEFFEREDSPHGLAKRVIEFRYLQKKIGSALNTEEPFNGYHFTYFDAFCGTGKYKYTAKIPNLSDTPIHPIQAQAIQITPAFVRQIREYGSPLVALHALITIFRGKGYKKALNKAALFVFEDYNKEYIQLLKHNVRDMLVPKYANWDPNKHGNENNWHFIMYKNMGRQQIISLNIEILFIVGTFKQLESGMLLPAVPLALNMCSPMTSFIDPFGFSHTPMEQVVSFLGYKKDVIFFFGVEAINRFQGVLEQQSNLTALMGFPNWRDYLPGYPPNSVPAKMKAYLTAYKKCLALYCQNLGMLPVRTCHISMRRGSPNGTDKHFIYDLIFISLDLKSLDRMKYAMGVGSENNDQELEADLYFSDFHRMNATWSTLNSRSEEANIILHAWSGKFCTFGRLKEWILTETSLQIHTQVFKDLKTEEKLEVVNRLYWTKVMKPIVALQPRVVNQVINVPVEVPIGVNVPLIYGNIPTFATTVVNTPTMSSTVINTPTPVLVENLEFKVDSPGRKTFPKYVGQLSTDPDEDEIKGKRYEYRNDWVLKFGLCDCDDCQTARVQTLRLHQLQRFF